MCAELGRDAQVTLWSLCALHLHRRLGAIIVPGLRQGITDDAPSATGVSTSSDAGPTASARERLSDHDEKIIGQTHHQPGAWTAAVRAYSSTTPSPTPTPRTPTRGAYPGNVVVGELLASVKRFADAEPEALRECRVDLTEV
jgi:hypothetical protein